MSPNTIRQAAAEYIVVGSGAGGGTVAARLAEAGRTVRPCYWRAASRLLVYGSTLDSVVQPGLFDTNTSVLRKSSRRFKPAAGE